jgi:hypothetical protein
MDGEVPAGVEPTVGGKQMPIRDSVRKRISDIPRRLAGPALAVLATVGLLFTGATTAQATAQAAAPAAAEVAPAARPAVAPGQQDLGGMTLLEYCKAFGWPDAFQDGSSPTGWWCSVGGGSTPRVILDLNAACQWQFADIVRVGFVTYSISGRCKTVATSANRISDLNSIGQYCQSIGYAKAVVTGSAVTSWYCANSAGAAVARIDLHAACRWVNQSNPARGAIVVSYFPSYNARFEITCVALVH